MTANEKPGKETYDSWHDDPKNWIWGVFYFNKNDKRLFPPKKIKQFGWTVNFANPASILAMFALIATILILANYFKTK